MPEDRNIPGSSDNSRVALAESVVVGMVVIEHDGDQPQTRRQ